MTRRKTEPLALGRGARTFLSPAEAAAILGVRRRTLYTYASRGLLRRARDGRLVRYLAEDVRRLAMRADAHRGHTAVAASALRWGEPVLDSAITDVSDGQLRYRGADAIALARTSTFEQVADRLFGGEDGPWPGAPDAGLSRSPGGSPLSRMLAALPSLAAAPATGPYDCASARALCSELAARVGAYGPGSIADGLARALELGAARARALDVALIVCADHELNASTFVCRIATSAGASLGGALAAALATFTGRRHGAACDRVEELLRSTDAARSVRAEVRARLSRGESIAGFGHPLYSSGDPRTAPLLEAAREHAREPRALAHALRVKDAVEQATGVPASVDFGLVSLCRALGLADGHAIAFFALGRSAGWLAHALEQRAAGELLRPRARYVGPQVRARGAP